MNPVIYFEYADEYNGPDTIIGVTLMTYVPVEGGMDVRPKIVGHLRFANKNAVKSLREALKQLLELRPE